LRFGMMNNKPLPYTVSFDEALREAVTTEPEQRQAKMAGLLKRSDARKAHPTFEHLLPIFVGAGAAAEDKGVRLWTLPEGSFSWAQYRFGELPVVA
jgi:4,5-DOPA dioxygenase extradiol